MKCRTFSSWSRHVSDGDHASQGAPGHPEHEDELFEWHRHPRKVQPRSNSSSPNNRFRRGRATSRHGNSPNRQKRFGNSLLPAPQMPEDGVASVFLGLVILFTFILGGSLEAKLPTVWTDGKAQPARRRARKKLGRGESQKGEDKRWRKSEERRCRCAKR